MRMHLFIIFLSCLLNLTLSNSSLAQDSGFSLLSSDPNYEMSAGIGIGMEFTDNVDNVATKPQSSISTNIKPTFTFKRLGGRIEADINYAGTYSFYLKNKLDPEYQHALNASVTANVIEDLLFVSISESMEQVYESVALEVLSVDDDAGDSRNRNIITLSPYINLQPTGQTHINIGYSFADTRYSLEKTNSTASFLSFDNKQYEFKYNVNQSHNIYFKTNHALTTKSSLYVGGSYTKQIYDDEASINLDRYNLYIGGMHEFSERLSANIEVGPNYSVPELGDASLSPYIQANLNYNVGQSRFALAYNTSFQDDLEAGNTVNKSTYSFTWAKSFDRTSLNLGLSYNTIDGSVSYNPNSTATEENNSISPKITINYALTPRTQVNLNYTGLLYTEGTDSDIHSASTAVQYTISENSSVNLSYRIAYTLPDTDDAYMRNQFFIDFTYSF